MWLSDSSDTNLLQRLPRPVARPGGGLARQQLRGGGLSNVGRDACPRLRASPHWLLGSYSHNASRVEGPVFFIGSRGTVRYITGRDGGEWRESWHSRRAGNDTPVAAVWAVSLAARAGSRPCALLQVLAAGCASPAASLPALVSPRAPRADTRVGAGGHRQGGGRLGTWYRLSFHHGRAWTPHRSTVHRSGVTRPRTRRVLPCNRGTPRWALAPALL